MKDFKTGITSILVVSIIWGAFAWFVFVPIILPLPEPEPLSTFECPCEVEQLVTDVVRHTNKDGIQTVTTYLDVSKCVGVKTNGQLSN